MDARASQWLEGAVDAFVAGDVTPEGAEALEAARTDGDVVRVLSIYGRTGARVTGMASVPLLALAAGPRPGRNAQRLSLARCAGVLTAVYVDGGRGARHELLVATMRAAVPLGDSAVSQPLLNEPGESWATAEYVKPREAVADQWLVEGTGRGRPVPEWRGMALRAAVPGSDLSSELAIQSLGGHVWVPFGEKTPLPVRVLWTQRYGQDRARTMIAVAGGIAAEARGTEEVRSGESPVTTAREATMLRIEPAAALHPWTRRALSIGALLGGYPFADPTAVSELAVATTWAAPSVSGAPTTALLAPLAAAMDDAAGDVLVVRGTRGRVAWRWGTGALVSDRSDNATWAAAGALVAYGACVVTAAPMWRRVAPGFGPGSATKRAALAARTAVVRAAASAATQARAPWEATAGLWGLQAGGRGGTWVASATWVSASTLVQGARVDTPAWQRVQMASLLTPGADWRGGGGGGSLDAAFAEAARETTLEDLGRETDVLLARIEAGTPLRTIGDSLASIGSPVSLPAAADESTLEQLGRQTDELLAAIGAGTPVNDSFERAMAALATPAASEVAADPSDEVVAAGSLAWAMLQGGELDASAEAAGSGELDLSGAAEVGVELSSDDTAIAEAANDTTVVLAPATPESAPEAVVVTTEAPAAEQVLVPATPPEEAVAVAHDTGAATTAAAVDAAVAAAVAATEPVPATPPEAAPIPPVPEGARLAPGVVDAGEWLARVAGRIAAAAGVPAPTGGYAEVADWLVGATMEVVAENVALWRENEALRARLAVRSLGRAPRQEGTVPRLSGPARPVRELAAWRKNDEAESVESVSSEDSDEVLTDGEQRDRWSDEESESDVDAA